MKVGKGMFTRLKKEMPQLNKDCLKWFIEWWEKREELKKILKTRELTIKEITLFKQICLDFSKFGESNLKHFNKHKIKWKVMEKYLLNDIKYCDRELMMKKSIDLTFEMDIKKEVKKEVKKGERIK